MKEHNEPIFDAPPNKKSEDIGAVSSQVLHLHHLAWQPPRFAHPLWLAKVGLKAQHYCYGSCPMLDKALNRCLIDVRAFPRSALPAVLTDQQKAELALEPRLKKICIALGLISLKCVEYLRIARYREAFYPTLNEKEMRQLLGIVSASPSPLNLTPELLLTMARKLGYGIFHSIESSSLVWRALSIFLPPLSRAIHFPKAHLWLTRLDRLL